MERSQSRLGGEIMFNRKPILKTKNVLRQDFFIWKKTCFDGKVILRSDIEIAKRFLGRYEQVSFVQRCGLLIKIGYKTTDRSKERIEIKRDSFCIA